MLWEKDGITVGEICEKLMLDNGTVSPLLKKMEKAGYITRSRSAEDDRVVSNDAQREFAESCSVCRRVIIPGSTHSMLWGTTETITAHLRQVLDHFV